MTRSHLHNGSKYGFRKYVFFFVSLLCFLSQVDLLYARPPPLPREISAVLNSTLSYTGNESNPRFGWSVAYAGDVNNDSYGDMVVGAYFANVSNGTAFKRAGGVYIYYGSKNGFLNSPNVTINGTRSLDSFGCSVSTAGDVNGDGYADILVGAWNARYSGTQVGKAYLFYGSSNGIVARFDTDANATLWGTNSGGGFGRTVADAGDVNNDGYGDFMVGKDNPDIVYLWYGSASGITSSNTSSANATISGFRGPNGFYPQRYLSKAGDFNGDGYGDIIIGDPNCDFFGIDYGAAYIFFGSANGILATISFQANL